MSDVSTLLNNFIGWIHGKVAGKDVATSSTKLLTDVEAYADGLGAAGPYFPTIVADTAALVATGASIAASKGLALPLYLQAGSELSADAAALAAAESAFLAKVQAFKAASAMVAAAPTPAPAS